MMHSEAWSWSAVWNHSSIIDIAAGSLSMMMNLALGIFSRSQNFLPRGKQVRALIHHVRSSKINFLTACEQREHAITMITDIKSNLEINCHVLVKKCSGEGQALCLGSTCCRTYSTSSSGTNYFQLRPSCLPFSSSIFRSRIIIIQRALGVNDAFTHHHLQYSTKKSKSRKKNKVQKDESDDEEDTDDEEDEFDDWDQEDEVGDDVKKDWKDLKMNVPSMRVDAVLSAGLGTSRKWAPLSIITGCNI